MKPLLTLLSLSWFVLLVGCGGPSSPAEAPLRIDQAALTSAPLVAVDGVSRPFRALAGEAPLTVYVFISAECPCLGSHLDRLRKLHAKYAPRGVQFFALDSEVGATPERAASEREALGLSFPVLVDAGAKVANLVEAEYATYSIVVDREGRVRYRGGIDSDKRKLHDDATPYVADALDDLLAGREPRRTHGKALGCSLRKW